MCNQKERNPKMLMRIVNEIRSSIKNENFIAALSLALILPDICGKAEYPNVKSTAERYKSWYEKNVGYTERQPDPYGSDMPYSSGEVIYQLRCSLFHQGNPGIGANEKKKIIEERCKMTRFVLTINDDFDGGTSMVSYVGNDEIRERELKVNIVNICEKLCRVSEGYYKDNKEKFTFFDYEIEDLRDKCK